MALVKFTPATSDLFYADAVLELFEASKEDPTIAQTVDVKIPKDTSEIDAAKLIAAEARAFQKAATKLDRTARKVSQEPNKDGVTLYFQLVERITRKSAGTDEVAVEGDAVAE